MRPIASAASGGSSCGCNFLGSKRRSRARASRSSARVASSGVAAGDMQLLSSRRFRRFFRGLG
eukprot:10955802-Alexandrium_andersonii.AAC.1